MKSHDMTFREWWNEHHHRYKAILFDIDGTLIVGRHAYPNSPQMLEWLRANDFPFFLLTNDGNHSPQEKSGLLARAGLTVEPEQIVSCGHALEEFVDENNLRGQTFYVLGNLGKPDFAENAGLDVCRDPKRFYECSGVIIGEGTYDWMLHINNALNFFIKYPDRPLIVLNPDSYWPNGKKDEVGIGAGGKARFLCALLKEMHIDKEPTYLGKPYPGIFEHTLHVLRDRYGIDDHIPHESVIMLGDSLRSDIQGANTMNFTSALVLTGITTQDQLEKAPKALRPDLVFPSI